jgi:hypothetical protein
MPQDKDYARREKEFKQQTASATTLLSQADAKSTEIAKQEAKVRMCLHLVMLLIECVCKEDSKSFLLSLSKPGPKVAPFLHHTPPSVLKPPCKMWTPTVTTLERSCTVCFCGTWTLTIERPHTTILCPGEGGAVCSGAAGG